MRKTDEKSEGSAARQRMSSQGPTVKKSKMIIKIIIIIIKPADSDSPHTATSSHQSISVNY